MVALECDGGGEVVLRRFNARARVLLRCTEGFG